MLVVDDGLRHGEVALRDDDRFRFAWSTPRAGGRHRLIVVIHGSERDHVATRDAFSNLARRHNVAVVAPLFPVGAVEPGYGDGYKFLREGDVDYIGLLDRLLAQFRADIADVTSQFVLFGFSGGAQFAQRYSLFRGRDLTGLIIAAPGGVTLPDEQIEWWPGLRGAEAAIGRNVDLRALQAVPMAVIVGQEDLSLGLVSREAGSRDGSAYADIAGTSRLERARTLHRAMTGLGATACLIELPGVGHSLAPNAQAACQVIEGWL